MKHQIKPFSTTTRLSLIIIGFLLLQFNVPVPRMFHCRWSADLTYNRPALNSLQNLDFLLASATRKANEALTELKRFSAKNLKITNDVKTFKIVKVESRKKVSKKLSWPVKGQISSGFGMRRHPVTTLRSFHNGIDIKARRGTKIVAPVDGKVLTACRAGLMGRMVKLRTSTGQHLYFGHMQKILCKKGDRVKKGQVLGTVGSSGRATGPHLHFSVKSSGKFINPTRLLSPLR
jgi:murein DD-endopeptidase MepM/ murein hydrolase activator NlpD